MFTARLSRNHTVYSGLRMNGGNMRVVTSQKLLVVYAICGETTSVILRSSVHFWGKAFGPRLGIRFAVVKG